MTATKQQQPPESTGVRSDNQTIHAAPLTVVQKPKARTVGRPEKLVMPPLPNLPMTPVEQELFDFFMEAYKQQYPDMVPTDHLLLHLAGAEYIKYMRILAEEMKTGKILSMARQHPAVQMRGLLDMLSVTRKARTMRNKPDDSPEEAELKDFFMSLSNGKTPLGKR